MGCKTTEKKKVTKGCLEGSIHEAKFPRKRMHLRMYIVGFAARIMCLTTNLVMARYPDVTRSGEIFPSGGLLS